MGLGCMRLSTQHPRNDDHAVRLIHTAIQEGITLFDTANAYCFDQTEVGHNERLIARALREWDGGPVDITLATKGGLIRPGGKWVPDGRAKSLRAACDASRKALNVDELDLYQLHAVDPTTPFLTSVRALAALQRDGMVKNLGLCNVTVQQLEAAQNIIDVASVQIELNPFAEEYLRNGVAEYCRDHRIPIIAYRPLGGDHIAKLRKIRILQDMATRHGATCEEIALAWLMDLYELLTPIPGATSLKSVASIARASGVALSDEDRLALDKALPIGRLLSVPRAARRPQSFDTGETILIMGSPGAGKSTVATEFVERGYARLNRDEIGGPLKNLNRRLQEGLASGDKHWVLDNTYPTRAARNAVIEIAWQYKVAVRCIWLTTPMPDIQVNVVSRMIDRLGHLPTPTEMRTLRKDDPTMLSPDAVYRYERLLETPTINEGFIDVEQRNRARKRWNGTHRAIFFDPDELSRVLKQPEGENTWRLYTENLQAHTANEWLLMGIAWRPEVETGDVSEEVVQRSFEELQQSLNLKFEIAYCPHRAGPPKCWCRKPMPGLVIDMCTRHSIDPTRSLLVGTSTPDRLLAEKTGVAYVDLKNWIVKR